MHKTVTVVKRALPMGIASGDACEAKLLIHLSVVNIISHVSTLGYVLL